MFGPLIDTGRVERVVLAALIRSTGATYVSMREAECPGGKCALVTPDGVPLHFDYGHFTGSGAAWVTQGIPAL